jgi:hypothetical protein
MFKYFELRVNNDIIGNCITPLSFTPSQLNPSVTYALEEEE